jgi:hypothetical protein
MTIDPLIGLTINFDAFEGGSKSEGHTTQVLPVGDLPDDWTGDPSDGEQYLFLVR